MAEPMKKAAENVWKMLDQMAEKSPEEYKNFVDQQLKEGAEMFTPPQPAFCLCCGLKKAAPQKHIFINVCKWDRVPKPKTDNDPVAVKGGVLRHPTQDGKRMASDLLIDIAFHTSVIEECERDSTLHDMLRDLILDFVAEFTAVELDRSSCSKLDLPYRGSREDLWYSLDEQWRYMLSSETRVDLGHTVLNHLKQQVKTGGKDNRKTSELPRLLPQDQSDPSRKSLIEEVKGDKHKLTRNNQPCTTNPGGTPSSQQGEEVPEHSVFITSSSGPSRKVKVKVTLPRVKSAAEVDLEVFEDHIKVGVSSLCSHFKLQLPVPVDKDRAKAAYNPGTNILSISIPCL